MKDVRCTAKALKQLRSIPSPVAKRIREKVLQLAADPAAQANNVKRLQGSEAYRLRVGDYRVIFTDDGLILTVTKIGPRGDVYE